MKNRRSANDLKLPEGVTVTETEDGRCKYELPNGATITETLDGRYLMEVKVNQKVLDTVARIPGARVDAVDRGKNLQLAWIPGIPDEDADEREHEACSLLDPIRQHIGSGAIAPTAVPDINRLVQWMTATLKAERLRAYESTLEGARLVAGQESARRRKGAATANERKPSAVAMRKIRSEWIRLQGRGQRYPGDAAFAKGMHAKHSDAITNEGSIKNAITKWRKGRESSC